VSVSKDQVEHIAALARLRLSGEEAERMAGDLNAILGHMEALERVDVSSAGAVGEMTEWPAPFRDPELVADPLARGPEAVAPDFRDGFFIVPRLPGVEGGEGEGPGA
jgi:aspartyl-tRNA(Asn)/glutamyl-tRNA(Gln) amidotransferase subunit C